MECLEVFGGHLHGGHDERAGVFCHGDGLVVDEVGVLQTAGPTGDRLLAALRRTGVNGDGQAELGVAVSQRTCTSWSNQVTRAGSSPGLK